jgi:hypothetical protein
MSSPILRGGNLIVTEQGIREGVRQVLLPLWNTWYFFSLYANASNYKAKYSVSSTDVLDRYLLAKTRDLITQVEADLNQYDSYAASARLRDFSDVLTNWYVRRSRDRFWAGNEEAFDTLYTVLEQVTRVVAPLLPMVAEEIWRGLTGGKSVHLESWPDASKLSYDQDLVTAMDQVRTVSSVALGLRKTNGLRVRLPLSKLTVVTTGAAKLLDFAGIIAEELNVKDVELVELAVESTKAFGVEKQLTVNSRALGPRLGKQVQEIIQAAKAGNWEQSGESVSVNGVALEQGEYEISLVAKDESSEEKLIGILPGAGGTIASLLSYSTEKRLSKNPEEFGKGAIEGVAGPEAANNSDTAGAMVPLLTLGVPGGGATAVMMGAFIMHGIQPGPLLFQNRPDLVWGLIDSMYIGNLMLLILNLPLIGVFVRLLYIPSGILYPLIIAISVLGTFAINGSMVELYLVLFFGVLGYIFDKVEIPIPPLVLSLVLAGIMEQSFRQALTLSDGNPMVFVSSGISATLVFFSAVSLALPFLIPRLKLVKPEQD